MYTLYFFEVISWRYSRWRTKTCCGSTCLIPLQKYKHWPLHFTQFLTQALLVKLIKSFKQEPKTYSVNVFTNFILPRLSSLVNTLATFLQHVLLHYRPINFYLLYYYTFFAPNIGQYTIKREIRIVHRVSQFPIIYLLKNYNSEKSFWGRPIRIFCSVK